MLTVTQPVKKFSAFYGTRRFIAASYPTPCVTFRNKLASLQRVVSPSLNPQAGGPWACY